MPTAFEALAFIAETESINTVLDVGSGAGLHADYLRGNGKAVETVSFIPPADYVGDFMQLDIAERFDCVWASHVLEHQLDANAFLRKCKSNLKPGGVFAVTVPPMKPFIVGGHVSLWNAGLLLYNLIMAGFDCSQAKVKTYGYNISVIVQNGDVPQEVFDSLHRDTGDIEKLADYFPMPVAQGFNGHIQAVNWK